MNLLKAALYDPAVAVNKVTTAALALTALDTTNLRLAITVPAHGMVRFRLSGTLHGATTMPQIVLGVLNGAAVVGRIAPMHGATNIAATSLVKVEADFIVTGLTPGAMNVDAAYGVETLVAATGLKYGGPNNTTANDAFGGFVFEAWDPQPQTANSTLAVDANGRVDVSKVLGAAINALVGGRVDSSVGAMANAVITAAAHAAGAIDANAIAADAIGSSELAATAVAEIVAGVWDELTATARTAGSYGQLVKDDLNATVSSRATAAALATVQADTDDIQTRLPAALVGGRMDASVGAMAAAVITAAAINAAALNGKGDWATVGAAMTLTAAYDAAKTAAQAGNAMTLTAAAIDAILDDPTEGALTARQILRILLAATSGKANGFPAGPVHYRDNADTKDRITATVDPDGNRTVVAVDGS